MRAALLLLATIGGGLAIVASRARASDTQSQSILETIGLGDVMQALKPDSNTPRGIRNNNPLNIERNNIQWYGMAPDQSGDDRFVIFKDARFGYRAAARILDNYRKRGITVLRDIIATWAPANENDVDAYVRHVSQRTGISATEHIEPDQYPILFDAMTWHENGENPYSLDFIAEGVSWAYA